VGCFGFRSNSTNHQGKGDIVDLFLAAKLGGAGIKKRIDELQAGPTYPGVSSAA
jgi:hypothetical protein